MTSPSSSLHIAGNSPPSLSSPPQTSVAIPFPSSIDGLGIICHLESATPCDGAVRPREIYSSAPEFIWALAAQPNEAASLLQNYDTLKRIHCFSPCGLLSDWSGSCHGCEKDHKRSIIARIAKRETALLWALQMSKNKIVVQALSFDSIISSISQTTSSCYTLGQEILKDSHLAKWLESCIKDDWRKLLNCGGPQQFISPPPGVWVSPPPFLIYLLFALPPLSSLHPLLHLLATYFPLLMFLLLYLLLLQTTLIYLICPLSMIIWSPPFLQ